MLVNVNILAESISNSSGQAASASLEEIRCFTNFLDKSNNKYFFQILFDKIFEEIMCSGTIKLLQITTYVHMYLLITVINITEKVHNALDSGQLKCGISVDLQRAFDTDHEMCLNTLIKYIYTVYIHGSLNSWSKSFVIHNTFLSQDLI